MRIVRKIAQYFYPQRQTQVMNEGWATFCITPFLMRCMTKVW
ncbi:MAG: SpoVR family protein [Thiolinea sp.]